MGRIYRTEASHQDYREIWHYIAADNVEAANRVVRGFDSALSMLSKASRGRQRARLGRGIRSFPVGEYLLFYRPAEEGIELLRVLYGVSAEPVQALKQNVHTQGDWTLGEVAAASQQREKGVRGGGGVHLVGGKSR